MITVTDEDKQAVLEVAKEFKNYGFKIKATEGTYRFLTDNKIKAESILKMHEKGQSKVSPTWLFAALRVLFQG